MTQTMPSDRKKKPHFVLIPFHQCPKYNRAWLSSGTEISNKKQKKNLTEASNSHTHTLFWSYITHTHTHTGENEPSRFRYVPRGDRRFEALPGMFWANMKDFCCSGSAGNQSREKNLIWLDSTSLYQWNGQRSLIGRWGNYTAQSIKASGEQRRLWGHVGYLNLIMSAWYKRPWWQLHGLCRCKAAWIHLCLTTYILWYPYFEDGDLQWSKHNGLDGFLATPKDTNMLVNSCKTSSTGESSTCRCSGR